MFLFFFILSGYMICASYLRLDNFRKYITFRIIRVFPALIVVLLLTMFVIGPLASSVSLFDYFRSMQTYSYFKNVTLFFKQYELTGFDTKAPTLERFSTNGALWTLRVEFSCYILIGIFGRIGKLTKHFILLLSMIILMLMCLLALKMSLGKLFLLLQLLNCFLSGCLFYLYRDQIKYSKWLLFVAYIMIILACAFGRGGGLNILYCRMWEHI